MAITSSWFSKLVGRSGAATKAMQPLVARINSKESLLQLLDDAKLAEMTPAFKEQLASGATLDDILPEAFALVREAARRTLGQRHFDAQLMGGIALHRGMIAEMKTGEGKTLVATLPVYLNALEGKGVHVVTVNDYLARRDAVWMGQIYAFLGMSVGCVTSAGSFVYDPAHRAQHSVDAHDSLDQERDALGSFKVMHEFLRPIPQREAYAADITYGTNNEFGFDYLRDNTAIDPRQLRQRGHRFAIVDEIDSILIDEARTPLIISMPSADSENLYQIFAGIVRGLTEDEDYTVDEKFRSTALTEVGIHKAERALGVENIYTERGVKFVHHLETAVRAKALYHHDKEYVVREGEVIIVDEFTGRLQPGRRWSEGLHQAVEAKEGVKVQQESRTAASITFQNYFRMYHKLAGMTGTAKTSSEEFFTVYGLDVTEIPTNRSIARIDRNDLIFQTEQGKFKAIAREVKARYEKGQPVLVGTVSIEKNELLSAYLRQEGIPHEILNAKNHEREGEIIAEAGTPGRVTIATNMAGRGVDIKLGGALATPEAASIVKEKGGLFVLGTERHEARRIDNQLRGRSGRQGDPGETQFFVSLEDSLMRIFAADTIKKMMGRLGIPEDEPIENRLITRSLESAQSKIEGFNFDARKRVLEYDNVLNQQRASIYAERRKILLGENEEIAELLFSYVGTDAALEQAVSEKRDALGEEFYAIARRLMLQTVDMFWMQHLEVMDYMRSSVNLRAYGQRDPLVEYKKEGQRLFREMQDSVSTHLATLLPHIQTGSFVREAEEASRARERLRAVANTAEGGTGSEQRPALSQAPKTSEGEKLGRNDPCFCGSGKKYKKCHGA
jgi:preprotein translocase subunit SecA